jgi:hypothetical protein
VHLNRYVVQQDFTCKHAVSLFAIVTFFFLPTVSHFLRDSAVDRAFYVFRYCTHQVHNFLSPSHKLRLRAKSSPVSQSTIVSHYIFFCISFSLFFCCPFAVDSTIDSRFVPSQVKSSQVKSSQINSSQVKSSQVKSIQVKSSQVKSIQATFDCQQSIMPEAKTVRAYKASLVKFISFLGGTKHPGGYEATDERLLKIQDTDVVQFVNWEAYHEEAPDVDTRSTYCRGSNLLSHK